MEANACCTTDTSDDVLPAGWPLLHLDPLVQTKLVELLQADERRSLRLTCTAMKTLVNNWVRPRIDLLELEAHRSHLQQRFPALARLSLVGIAGAAGEDAKELVQSSPLTSITSLRVDKCHMRGVLELLPCFPALRHLRLGSIANVLQQRPSFVDVCQQLPHLASVELEGWWLDTEKVATLAALPALTALEGSIPSALWRFLKLPAPCLTTLADMQALRSLRMHLPEGVSLPDFSRMAALTQLEIRMDARGVFKLQLPSTLVQLRLPRLPDAQLPPLPQLTFLALDTAQPATGKRTLAWIAANCTQLASLEVRTLALLTDCCAAPLLALTALSVTGSVGEQAGVRYAEVFPALQALAFTGQRSLVAGAARWGGLTALTRLSFDMNLGAGSSSSESGASALGPADFQALAALPALRAVRLDVRPPHVAGVQVLTQLRSLEWAFGCMSNLASDGRGGGDVLQPTRAAFVTGSVPQQLHCVTISVVGLHDSRISFEHGRMANVVLAAIEWLAHGPCVDEVRWQADARSLALTAPLLSAVTAVAGLRRSVITSSAPGDSVVLLRGELEPVLQGLTARGVDVVYVGAAFSGH